MSGEIARADFTLRVPREMADRMERLRQLAGHPRTLTPFALQLLETALRAAELSTASA